MSRLIALDGRLPVRRDELEPILEQVTADILEICKTLNTHSVAVSLIMTKLGITPKDLKDQLDALGLEGQSDLGAPKIVRPN